VAKAKRKPEARVVRLTSILERHRTELAPDLSDEFVREVAEIEENFQFENSREDAKRRIRQALAIEVQQRLLVEEADED
jgi:hypothetical protein